MLDLKDFVTLAGAALGLVATVLVVLGKIGFWPAFALILLAVACDYLDGRIARKTGKANDFGRELDSLADAVAFGFAPPAIALSLASFSSELLFTLNVLGGVVFLSAGLIRLARYNLQEDKTHYVGLPIPLAAVFALLSFVFLGELVFVGFLAAGYLMVSGLKIRKRRIRAILGLVKE